MWRITIKQKQENQFTNRIKKKNNIKANNNK